MKIIRAGICNTDVELLRGYYPYAGVLGHEFVGVVESDGEWKGKRVVGEINARCGKCEACLHKNRNHCEHRTVLGIQDRNGVFAEYTTLPYENLHEVPHNVSEDEAVFTEPLAAALQIPQQVQIHPEDRVVLIGDGKLGLLCAQVVALSGCDLTVIGKHENKLEILKRRGIKTAIWNPKSPTSGNVEDVDSQKADVAIEVTGSPGGFEMARGYLRGGGRLVLKSTYAGKLTLDISSIVVDEITIIGSRCGPFKAALDLLARKSIDVGSFVHARYTLDDAVTAMEKAQEAGVLKVLLDVS
ncbi:MAG: alcohol dehydrogenase catalytic domain-containing protein [Chloroflexi bacterium]|nr:alcohol dehydrogenase catalytic domain-containing protein [Chloroflexota bacterium]